MKKLYSFLPALIFLVFLGVMALLLLFSPVRDYSENVKRYLAGRPEVTVSGILEGETQEQLEKFTADQVPGRDFFVGVNAYWNLATGRNGAQDIYHCKQGYLINAPKTYNEKIFTDNLTKFDQFAAQLGVPADLMMVPSTGYLMKKSFPRSMGPTTMTSSMTRQSRSCKIPVWWMCGRPCWRGRKPARSATGPTTI